MVAMRLTSFFIIAGLSLIIGCSPSPKQSSTPVIRMAIAQAPLNLDPRYATDAASERVNRLLYQRLVEFDARYQVVPSLADWHMVSPQHYQFTLKQKAIFHDGQTLNAHDVKATYESLLALRDAPHRAEFAHIARIEVQDNQTVSFFLSKEDKHFVEKLIIGILPKSQLAQGHDFSRAPIGSGPVKFVRWPSALTLARVRDGQQITLTEVKDPTVRVLKLVRGEVDLLQGDLPPELVKYLQLKPEITVKTNQGTNFSYLGLNMQDPVLSNLSVRKAIAHAIDRQAIIQQVMVDNTRLAGAILPPEHFAGNAGLAPYAYRPQYAKQLLQQAGVKLPLKLVYKTSTDAQRVRFATILQAQMAPAGIDLEIRSLDWGTFFEDVKQGHFQLYGLTWVGIKTPEIYLKAFGSQYVPPHGFNRGRFQDATTDALLADENWPAATQRIHQQLPYIPLWYEGQFAAYRPTIQHYLPKSDGNWDGLASVE
jgi:peptide/nickel transport system substrate-binding protein